MAFSWASICVAALLPILPHRAFGGNVSSFVEDNATSMNESQVVSEAPEIANSSDSWIEDLIRFIKGNATSTNQSHNVSEAPEILNTSDSWIEDPSQVLALLESSSSYHRSGAKECARIAAATYCRTAGPGVSHARIVGSGAQLAVVGRWHGHCIAAFRGTDNAENIREDLESLRMVPLPGCSGCMVGEGILRAYQSVAGGVKAALHHLGCKQVAVTGHSLGANMAILALSDLARSGFQPQTSYTFGQSRIGNVAFHRAWKVAVGHAHVFRFVHGEDPIVRVGPVGSLTYEGTRVYLPGASVKHDHSCYLGIGFKRDTLLRGRVCGVHCNMYP